VVVLSFGFGFLCGLLFVVLFVCVVWFFGVVVVLVLHV